jgi:hypothetical protein
MVKERVELYEEEKLNVVDDEIAAMAKRFNVRKEDVVFAVWKMGKSSVWAQLALDLKEKEKDESEKRREND